MIFGTVTVSASPVGRVGCGLGPLWIGLILAGFGFWVVWTPSKCLRFFVLFPELFLSGSGSVTVHIVVLGEAAGTSVSEWSLK